jgi:hypothetical protein
MLMAHMGPPAANIQLDCVSSPETRTSSIGTAALNALSACVVVVEGVMQVLHVNEPVPASPPLSDRA